MKAKDHRVVRRGADLIEWTELRRGSVVPQSGVLFWHIRIGQPCVLELSCSASSLESATRSIRRFRGLKWPKLVSLQQRTNCGALWWRRQPTQIVLKAYARYRTRLYCQKSTKPAPCSLKEALLRASDARLIPPMRTMLRWPRLVYALY
uniref:Uncharacterized protein n=1 Tax=Hyaloperonospora arabidopsidis (strain Emoy2) TaxID=559515 RepID=M4BPF8_HYAAE